MQVFVCLTKEIHILYVSVYSKDYFKELFWEDFPE